MPRCCRRRPAAWSAASGSTASYAATYRFRDAPRHDGRPFIDHLGPRHHLTRVLLVSGDRESEVRYLAGRVGITEVYAGCSPEEKVTITREETRRAPTIFIGDGINDAPALVTATVGLAFGHQSEVTAEAAGAVIMDTSLKRVDELFHIARRMRRIALQRAVGGMALSVAGMLVAVRRPAAAGRRRGVPGNHRPGRGAERASGRPARRRAERLLIGTRRFSAGPANSTLAQAGGP